jgi:PAS domain S-box-containing protein
VHTALFDAIPDALVIVDEAGFIVMANRMAYRLFRYEPPMLVGQKVELLVPEELREHHRRHRRSYRRQPRERAMGHASMALHGVRSDGSRFPVEIALNPVRLGERMQVLASIRDVSDTAIGRRVDRRLHYDAALAGIGERIVGGQDITRVMQDVARALGEAMGTGPVWLLLRDGDVRGLVRDFGLTRTPRAWLREHATPLLDALASHGALHACDTRIGGARLPDGMRAGLAHALKLDDGSVSGGLVAFSRDPEALDIDIDRLLQTAATMLSARLQRERSDEALAHGQRLEAIGKLTGGVAHDFNNLLTVVAGNLQMLEAHVEDDVEAQELLAAAARAADQGAALTRKLLSFAGRQRLRPGLVSLSREVKELERLMRATLGERIVLTLDADPDTRPVRVDASMLDSVVLNLVLNARDAIDGHGAVEVSVRDALASDASPAVGARYVELSVRDTGSGMSEETLAHAWEPFFTTKPPGRGTGLGLSMVYGFIRQSGGDVRLRSQPGEGTTVTLCLPVADDADLDTLATLPSVVGGSEVVLVVEDDDAVRTTVEGSLKSLGYHVIATGSPKAALECVEALGDIALLFTDLALDGSTTGVQLAREAQALRPDLAVLLTSGYPDATDAARLDEFALLAKPYRREDLAAALRSALNEARPLAAHA